MLHAFHFQKHTCFSLLDARLRCRSSLLFTTALTGLDQTKTLGTASLFRRLLILVSDPGQKKEKKRKEVQIQILKNNLRKILIPYIC
jgi:hypothetical protein